MTKTRGKAMPHVGDVGRGTDRDAIYTSDRLNDITDCGKSQVALYKTNRAEILKLADHALTQANHYRALWLATSEPRHWQLWQACLQDRLDLLEGVGQ
jgi:hypothetical protein